MTPEQASAFIQAQSVAAYAEIMGMCAKNYERKEEGFALAYDADAFFEVAERFGITHNQVLETFREANETGSVYK